MYVDKGNFDLRNERCKRCGHTLEYHDGFSKKGYNSPRLKCLFETDRYEVCTCDEFVPKKPTTHIT